VRETAREDEQCQDPNCALHLNECLK